MQRLRGPGGCPWDREQTHRSLARHLLEETHETLEAIDAGDRERLREELGDVLLQVVFHAEMALQEGTFDVDDVAEGITTKLIRRHPHVFGDLEVDSAAEVLVNWERIKTEEKGEHAAGRRDPGHAARAGPGGEGPAARSGSRLRLADRGGRPGQRSARSWRAGAGHRPGRCGGGGRGPPVRHPSPWPDGWGSIPRRRSAGHRGFSIAVRADEGGSAERRRRPGGLSEDELLARFRAAR